MLEIGVRLLYRVLGLRLRTVCYVEREAYAASTLVARMEDSSLDRAPVWDDLKTFDGRPWRGIVDCLTAGYPCPPFSCAGKRLGTKDPRHLWPDVRRIAEEAQPGLVFLENVPGHLTLGYFDVVKPELQELGYRVTEGLFASEEVGASHARERLLILGVLADTEDGGRGLHAGPRGEGTGTAHLAGPSEELAHTAGGKCEAGSAGRGGPGPSGEGEELADACGAGLEGLQRAGALGARDWAQALGSAAELRRARTALLAPGPGEFDLWSEILEVAPGLEPALCLLPDGLATEVDGLRVPYRTDQLRMVGNGVQPVAAALGFLSLFSCAIGDGWFDDGGA